MWLLQFHTENAEVEVQIRIPKDHQHKLNQKYF